MKKLVISMFVSCAMLCVGCGHVNSDTSVRVVADTVQDGTPFNLTPSTGVKSHEKIDDRDSTQLAICEEVLDGCIEAGVLDASGVERYRVLRSLRFVSHYIELITECEQEDIFYDTVGESDAWYDYVHCVLAPRGLAD